LALVGILQLGRRVSAPPAIGGDWELQVDAGACPAGVAGLRHPALSISQSGTSALVTVNDGRTAPSLASIEGATVTAAPLTASISGPKTQRILEGRLMLEGCAPVAFRGVRQATVRKAAD
jgi:hypothetical protein